MKCFMVELTSSENKPGKKKRTWINMELIWRITPGASGGAILFASSGWQENVEESVDYIMSVILDGGGKVLSSLELASLDDIPASPPEENLVAAGPGDNAPVASEDAAQQDTLPADVPVQAAQIEIPAEIMQNKMPPVS